MVAFSHKKIVRIFMLLLPTMFSMVASSSGKSDETGACHMAFHQIVGNQSVPYESPAYHSICVDGLTHQGCREERNTQQTKANESNYQEKLALEKQFNQHGGFWPDEIVTVIRASFKMNEPCFP